MIIHPSAMLLAWLAFAVALPWFALDVLAALSVLIAVGLWLGEAQAWWRLIRRMRFLLLALMLLYAWMTPGTPVFSRWDVPTQEGIQQGAVQAWRLLLLVSALALVLSRLGRERLLAGLYGLLLPLHKVLPVDRLAVRLWLTMHYADNSPEKESLQSRWSAALSLPHTPSSMITLEYPDWAWRDLGFVIGISAVIAVALLW